MSGALFALTLVAARWWSPLAANVPLNDELARAGNPDGIADLAAIRDRGPKGA